MWGAASERSQREDLGEQDYCPFEEKAAWHHHKRDRLPSLVPTHEVIRQKTKEVKKERPVLPGRRKYVFPLSS